MPIAALVLLAAPLTVKCNVGKHTVSCVEKDFTWETNYIDDDGFFSEGWIHFPGPDGTTDDRLFWGSYKDGHLVGKFIGGKIERDVK